MEHVRKRRRAEWPKMLVVCVGIVALAAAAFVGVRAAWGMYGKFAAAATAHKEAEAELHKLYQQHAQVKERVEALSTARGVEGEVRDRYGLARPGEGQITIVREKASTTPAGAEGGGIWRSLVDLFTW